MTTTVQSPASRNANERLDMKSSPGSSLVACADGLQSIRVQFATELGQTEPIRQATGSLTEHLCYRLEVALSCRLPPLAGNPFVHEHGRFEGHAVEGSTPHQMAHQ